MGFIKEFRQFAIQGNVIDLAVGVIIGAAFGKIVSSLVEDVITPLLLNPALKSIGAENISQLTWNGVKYGSFIAAVINFLCIAIVLFMIIKAANKVKKPVEVVPEGPSSTDVLLAEIRDELRRRP